MGVEADGKGGRSGEEGGRGFSVAKRQACTDEVWESERRASVSFSVPGSTLTPCETRVWPRTSFSSSHIHVLTLIFILTLDLRTLLRVFTPAWNQLYRYPALSPKSVSLRC